MSMTTKPESGTAELSIPSAESLMTQARELTGLEDFGIPSFREGLDRFLASMREEACYFTQEGIDRFAASFVDRLSHRLMIEDWYARHPEIEDIQPVSPVMITGLPRTGTSAFANILSIEPALRCLRAWEQLPPVPPPILGEEETDPRRQAAQKRIEAMVEKRSAQLTMHLFELDSTTEDVPLLSLDFRSQNFTAPVFGYHAWWRDNDMRSGYAYQRRVVKLLQSRRPPNRWLFKAPHYAFHLEALCSVYPDARFIITHRDPVHTLPSWASLLTSLFPPGSRELIPVEELGRRICDHQAIGMRRMIEARKRIGEDRFLDVHHHEFVDDPIGVLRRTYEFIGMDMGPETEAGMREWSQRNKPGTFGKHSYSAAQFGMNERDIREQFAFYTDRYDVRLEAI